MKFAAVLTLLMLQALACGPVAALPEEPRRGRLLYDTHCHACHSEQLHWRVARQAADWPKLLAQVRRWQAEAKLQWSDDDIEAVARHLNDSIYHHPAPERTTRRAPVASALPPPA